MSQTKVWPCQAQVKLAPDELEEVVRLCHTFVQMVQPPQITLVGRPSVQGSKGLGPGE